MALITEARRSRRESIIRSVRSVPPWLILCVLTLLFFWRLWAPNPADRQVFAYGDFVEQFYPLRRFAADELKAGRLPLWNPYIYAGTPALADPQWAALYPPTWISAFLPPWPPLPFAVLQAEAVVHIALAGIFTYLFARRHLAPPAALLAAITYAFGGYLTSYPPLQLAVLETATWLPLCLWAAETLANPSPSPSPKAGGGPDQDNRLSSSVSSPPSFVGKGVGRLGSFRLPPSAFRLLLSALPLTLAFLAGHPQTVLLITYASVAYYLVCARHQRLPIPATVGRLVLWGLAVLGLTAVQWLPTLELARLGPRLVLPYAEAAVGFTWRDLAHILLPGAWGTWSPLYIGAAPLLLAAIAVARGRGRFWLALALVGLLLALGSQGGLYWLAYHLAPGFNLFRHQERAALLWSFALAMLAGHGLHWIIEDLRLKTEGLRITRGVVSPPADAATGPLHASSINLQSLVFNIQSLIFSLPLAATALAVALLTLWTWRGQPGDSRLALWTSLATYSAVMLAIAAWLVHRLRHAAIPSHFIEVSNKPRPIGRGGVSPPADAATAPLRASSIKGSHHAQRTIQKNDSRWPLMALIGLVVLDLFSTSGRGLLQTPPPGGYITPNPIVWAIQADTDGLYRVSSEGLLPPGGGNGAVLWQLEDVVGNSPLHLAAQPTLLRDVPELVWWRLLNVRYVITQREVQHGALAEIERVGDARLYRLAGSLPRAWVTPGLRLVADQTQLYLALADPAFDPLVAAITADPSASSWGLPAFAPPLAGVVADITRLSPTTSTITVTSPQPGVLIVSEAYAPGWRAWVNGQAASVIQVNGLLRATPIPAGASTVEWRYEPWTVRVGLAVSAVTLLLLTFLWRVRLASV